MTLKADDPTQRLTPAERQAIFAGFVAQKRAVGVRGSVLVLRDDGFWYDRFDRRVCGAKTRRGYPCPTNKIGENGRCRMHGMHTPSGPATKMWKGGYALALAKRPKLRNAYERQLQATDPVSVRDDIVLLTAQIEQLLDGAAVGSAEQLPLALAAFQTALASKDPLKITSAFQGMKDAIDGSVSEERVWGKILTLQRQKGRLARTEHLHVIAHATMIDAASAWALVHAFVDLVKTHVADREARRAIADGITRLVGRGETSGHNALVSARERTIEMGAIPANGDQR